MKRIIVFVLLLSGCGFQPLYKTSDNVGGQNYKQDLASIQIKEERKRINQELRNNLKQVLNPDDLKIDPKYLLTVGVQKGVTATFITSTGSSGRNQVTLTAKYQLKDLTSNKIISSGTTNAIDYYTVNVDQRFANYIAEDSIASNLTLVLAQNIRNLLVIDLSNNK